MNLDTIPQPILLARGEYATVRSAHEDEKKRMAILCGSLSATATQILRAVQPDNNAAHDGELVAALVATGRDALARIETCAATIAELATQRAGLKTRAWAK